MSPTSIHQGTHPSPGPLRPESRTPLTVVRETVTPMASAPVAPAPATPSAARWPTAIIDDPDPLTRTAAGAALRRLCSSCEGVVGRAERAGCTPECLWHGSLRLVGAHGMAAVAACPARAITPAPATATVVYVLRDRLAAALHLLHGCADAVAVLTTDCGGARLELLEDAGPLARAGLTPREADILALLLARAVNEEIAARLVVSPATVRAHCRSVLRKLGAARRQDLWRLFDRPPV